MPILFVGSSPSDIGGTVANTTALGRDANFTPVGAMVAGTETEFYNNSGRGFLVNWDDPVGDLWIHYLNNFNRTVSNANADGWVCRFLNGASYICRIKITDDMWYMDGDVAVPVAKFGADADVTVDHHFTTTGTVMTWKMYYDGSLAGEVDITTALPVPDRVSFEFYDYFGSAFSSVDAFFRFSEFIVTDGEPTLGWRLSTLDAASQGFHSDWEGDYTGITDLSNGGGISSETVGEKESWGLSAYAGPATPGGIRAVVSKLMAAQGNAGPQNIVPFARIGGTDYEQAAVATFDAQNLVVMDNNPATGVSWLTTELATLELGVKADT